MAVLLLVSLATARSTPGSDQSEDLGGLFLEQVLAASLDIQPQQRLRIRRAQVEPPVVVLDRQAVQAILASSRKGRRHPLDHRMLVGDLGVDLTRVRVAAVRSKQLRKRSTSL